MERPLPRPPLFSRRAGTNEPQEPIPSIPEDTNHKTNGLLLLNAGVGAD